MNQITNTHHKAMEYVDDAIVARRRGDQSTATTFLKEAFILESEAAELAQLSLGLEPTRSILFRSAASLALQLGDSREAERLICIALSGKPPKDVAEELRDLWEQANAQRHLALRGISLGQGEFQLSLAGKSIGYGLADSNLVFPRIQATEKMVFRTRERRQGNSFRERGPAKKSVKTDFRLFMTVPRAASFAMSLKLGGPTADLSFPEADLDETVAIVDEVLGCLELFNGSEELALRERIGDRAYYDNFVGLARQLAPDGELVDMVGLTSIQAGKERQVLLSRTSNFLYPSSNIEDAKPKADRITIQGFLKVANSRDPEMGHITIVDATGKAYSVTVPVGMMSDIVKPLWEETVIVTGLKIGRKIMLEEIRLAPEEG